MQSSVSKFIVPKRVADIGWIPTGNQGWCLLSLCRHVAFLSGIPPRDDPFFEMPYSLNNVHSHHICFISISYISMQVFLLGPKNLILTFPFKNICFPLMLAEAGIVDNIRHCLACFFLLESHKTLEMSVGAMK